ncbi:MAG: PAS domain S-box protein [Chloroflexi bacterium]|nr:PAS domain S-box protein [Chloroflexota bacterium]
MKQLLQVLDKLIVPVPIIAIYERYRARFLLIMLIVLFFVWPVIFVVGRWMLTPLDGQGIVFGGVTAVILLSYLLARTRYYRWGAFFIAIFINLLIIAFSVWQQTATSLPYLILPLLFTTLFFSIRKIGYLLVANVVGFIWLNAQYAWFTQLLFVNTLFFYSISSFLLLCVAAYRNRLEWDNQKGLVESRERYRTLLATSFDGMAMVQQGKIHVVNAGFLDLFGYTREQAEQQTIISFVPELNQLPLLESLENGIAPQETTGVTQTGSLLTIEVAVRENKYLGESVKLIAVRDITARKQAEIALQKSEAQNQALLAAMPDTMLVISRNGRCLDYRPSPQFAVYMPFAKVIDQPIETIFPENEVDKVQYFIEQALLSSKTKLFESKFLFTDAPEYIYEVRLTVISGQDQVLALLRNVTERKWAEATLLELSQELESRVEARTVDLKNANEALQKSENQWRSLVGFSPDMIATFDVDCRLTFLNRGIAWVTPENVIGRSIWDLRPFAATKTVQSALTKTIETAEMTRFELPIDIEGFPSMWFECRLAPIIEMDEMTAVLLVATDITEREHVKQKLERRNRELAAFNSVITAVSHSLGLSEVFRQLEEQLAPSQGVIAGGVLLYDEPSDILSIQSEWGFPDDFFTQYEGIPVDSFYYADVIREKTPILTEDFRRIPELVDAGLADACPDWQSHLCVPLVAKGEVQGLFGLFSKAPEMFNAEQLAFFHSLGQQVGIAVQNSRLFESAQGARQIAEILQTANLALTKSLDLDTVLNTFLAHLQRLIPYDSATVMLLVSEGVMINYASNGYEKWGDEGLQANRSMHIESFGNLRTIMETESSLLVRNTMEVSGWQLLEGSEHIKSWLGVPLIAGGRIIGLYGLDRAIVDGFTAMHLQLAEALAAQAAVAIQNALLFDQVRSGREQLRILAQQVVMAQEDERMRVSRELHDEAGQALTALKISLALILRSLPHDNDAMIDNVAVRRGLELAVNLCESTMNQIRLLAHDLRPAALDDLGLNPALEGFCDDFADRTGLTIYFSPGEELEDMTDAVGISFYRFLQEALTNVVRHANATVVHVHLQMTETAVSLTVADNGKGIEVSLDTVDQARETGIGLAGIRERLQLLGGALTLESQPGKGTTFIATVPQQKENGLQKRQTMEK